MSKKEIIAKIGFAIAILSTSITLDGYQQILGFVAAGIILLTIIAGCLKRVSSKPGWQSFLQWVGEEWDLTYIAFGLGLMSAGSAFLNEGFNWAALLLIISGILVASYAIGVSIGKGYVESVKKDPRAGIIIGVIFFIGGVVYLVLQWYSILEKPLLYAPYPIGLVILGIIFVCVGCIKLAKIKVHKNPANKRI